MLKKLPLKGDYFMIDKIYEVKDNYIYSECENSWRVDGDAFIYKFYRFERVD